LIGKFILSIGIAALSGPALPSLSLAQAASAPTGSNRIELNGTAGGDRFDGIGAVSGGGATSVLLKDYPAKQRSEVLDLLFKPQFGASISTLYVEVPGDGNSTQGSEPSHMHSKTDENYYRGYEWWLMKEARKRNPALSLDACAWGCPGWVGNGSFWSQDMCDYYVKWINGLKSAHGMTLDAIGCRNEKGVNEDFIKMFRKTLNSRGLNAVKLHGFDNWGSKKWDWCKDLLTDPELAASVDAISNHTMTEVGTPASVRQISKDLHKPIWNSEEHIYKEGFDCEISIVQAFNKNYIRDGVTKITNWYLVASVYDTEPYGVQPSMLIANSPWSGAYSIRPALWGYAHYGQFTKLGWEYLNGGCANLAHGGSYVTLKSPGSDYSIIAETKGASQPQTVNYHVSGGLSTGKLCVWRSNAAEQFARLPDIQPVNGAFSITFEPDAIYSLSTTTGQQKGSFPPTPQANFPLPYHETFDHYTSARAWGYLPHYTADIVGVFELADRPDHKGGCLRQVIGDKAQSWAPEWLPYTVIGDPNWKDYEVSADMLLENGGSAGLLGRVNSTGNGWDNTPKGYYMTVSADGSVDLRSSTQAGNNPPGDQLDSGTVPLFDPRVWHTLKLRFVGGHIDGFVDGKQVVKADSTVWGRGMAGLLTGGLDDHRNTALFDNLIINTIDGSQPPATVFAQDSSPIYK